MAKLQIDLSGREGLAPRFFGDVGSSLSSPNLRYLGGKGQLAEGVYNPLRKYGYMCASESTFTTGTVASTTPTLILKTSIYDSMNDDFYFAGGQYIYKGSDLSVINIAEALDLTSSGTPNILDLEIYTVNDITKLFFVYETGGDMEIGISDLPYDISDDNLTWLSGTVSGAFTNTFTNINNPDAFIRKADNGFMYLFQDNNIHKIDGTSTGGANGTITANVIQFPYTFTILDAIDYKGYILVLIKQDIQNLTSSTIQSTSEIGVYVWDRQSTVVNTRDYIPITGAQSGNKIYVAPNGNARIMVTKANKITEIREYTGSTFKPIQEVGINAFPGVSDSLTQIDGLTVWLSNDNYILGHGSILPGEKEGIFRLGKLADSASINPGAILYGGDGSTHKNTLYMSYHGDAFSFVNWDMNGTTTAEKGNIYTKVEFLPQMSIVKSVEFYCTPITNTGTTKVADIKTYFNQSTTPFKTHNADRDQVSRGYVDIELNKPYVNAIQFEIEHSTNGTSEFCPSFAIVDYEPTSTKGSQAS